MNTYNEKVKRFKRSLARRAMLAMAWLVDHVPFPVMQAIAQVALYLAFLLTFRLRQIARDSLKIAFGNEKSNAEISRIIDGCFASIRKDAIELMYYSRFPERVTEKFRVEGRENLDEVLKKGRGAMIVTAHFGNFPVMMLELSQLGYKINVIMRRARDGKIADYILKIMNRVGVHTIYTHPRRECVQEAVRVMRNNEILFVLLDQHFGSEGHIMVDFFGQKAATATGPIILAQRTGSPVLMAFAIREKNGYHRVVIEPEFQVQQARNDEEALQHNVERITQTIERYVRAYPQEWGWMHRRWKGQQ